MNKRKIATLVVLLALVAFGGSSARAETCVTAPGTPAGPPQSACGEFSSDANSTHACVRANGTQHCATQTVVPTSDGGGVDHCTTYMQSPPIQILPPPFPFGYFPYSYFMGCGSVRTTPNSVSVCEYYTLFCLSGEEHDQGATVVTQGRTLHADQSGLQYDRPFGCDFTLFFYPCGTEHVSAGPDGVDATTSHCIASFLPVSTPSLCEHATTSPSEVSARVTYNNNCVATAAIKPTSSPFFDVTVC